MSRSWRSLQELWGLYWRSVFTGVEHYLLRCQQFSGSVWAGESIDIDLIDLPITRTKRAGAPRLFPHVHADRD